MYRLRRIQTTHFKKLRDCVRTAYPRNHRNQTEWNDPKSISFPFRIRIDNREKLNFFCVSSFLSPFSFLSNFDFYFCDLWLWLHKKIITFLLRVRIEWTFFWMICCGCGPAKCHFEKPKIHFNIWYTCCYSLLLLLLRNTHALTISIPVRFYQKRTKITTTKPN